MRILVIGASGHIGSYLVKRLVEEEEYEVTAVMRGERHPYGYCERIWSQVDIIKSSRKALIDSDFFENREFDAICDLIAYTLEDVKGLIEKIKNDCFYLQIGSIWAYGGKEYLPVDERHPKNAFSEYGRLKGVIEDYLFSLVKEKRLRATVVHPGHICAKEWAPVNPQGNLDTSIYESFKRGEQVFLPFMGMMTLHHIHSDDLARIIVACLKNQHAANGEAFNAVCERPETTKALCEYVYEYYGKTPKIKYVEWDEFERAVGKQFAEQTLEHAIHSPYCSVEKAKRILGVEIKYTERDIFEEYLKNQ